MLIIHYIAGIVSVGLMATCVGVVCAQTYPTKPIRIVTSEVGGPADFTVRLIAKGISGPLGQPVITDNRAGTVTGDMVAKAPADGYTLLLDGGSFFTAPLLQPAPYDPVRDFSPVTAVISSPNVLVVHPALPARTVRDLIDLAKARPGTLNYSSGTVGSSSYLSGELFAAMAGVNMVHVPYKGAAPALNALLAGEVQAMIGASGTVAPHVKSGKLRALAVTSAQPSVLAPGLPTLSASGLPGYEAVQILGMFAPAKSPEAVIRRLNQEIVRVLNTADVKEQLLNFGMETTGSTPEELAARVRLELAKWGKLIKDTGMRAN